MNKVHEEQLEALKEILSELKIKRIYPDALIKMDQDLVSENKGNYFIATMEDTEIRYNENGFSIFDYHNEYAPVVYFDKKSFLSYIHGQECAYCAPLISNGNDYFFCKGYFEKMNRLMELMKEEIEGYENSVKTNNRA